MRRTILAALAALAVLPSPAFASAPRAARYEAYPAVGWQKLDEVEQKRLTRIAYGGKDYDSMVQAWNAKDKAGVWDEPFPEYSYRWADATPHPELTRLLPEVRFLGQRVKINTSTAGPWGTAIALFKGRLYELRSLNKLLADYGFKFDTTEISAVAKIAVLWTLMDQHAGNAFGLGPDTAARATAIPAVTFKSVERTKRLPGANPYLPYAVDCMVNGEPVTYRVEFGKGYVVSLFEGLDNMHPLVNFYPPGLFKKRSVPPAPQK